MSRIRLLDDHLISQIAAGEVVERPASVVKELLENSLDAAATEIDLDLDSGGKARIRLADDGSGMGRDDALLAFDRHATSKIGSFEDLERVRTLGFRGEALASIAAVSRVELVTAEEPGEGQRVRIHGGRIVSAEPTPRARGTTIEVASLFYNVPARRKFLKRPQTELRRVMEVVQGYVLARPELRLTLRHEGRELLALPPTTEDRGGRRERIAQIFGAELAAHLVPLPELPQLSSVSGLVGDRGTARGRRQFVFVNRRLLRDRAILAVFYRAVREQWKGEDFPALFLFLDLPPEEVDVNVHPQKAEVRFRDSSFLVQVEEALREGLARARAEEPAPLREADAGGSSLLAPGPLAWQEWRGSPEKSPTSDYGDSGEGPSAVPGAMRTISSHDPGSREAAEVREGLGAGHSDSKLAEVVYAPLSPTSVPLSGRGGGRRSFRLLGQYKGTVLLLEGPDGLYLVDQHVAHERILYERFRRALASDRPPNQSLLEPLLLDLAPSESQALSELGPELESCGISLTTLSAGTIALTAVPAVLSVAEAERLLLALAARTAESGSDGATQDLHRRLVDSLAASLACRSAVKMHHPLTQREMEALVSELFEAEHPYACPHGRPIVLRMTDSDLERRFGRR